MARPGTRSPSPRVQFPGGPLDMVIRGNDADAKKTATAQSTWAG